MATETIIQKTQVAIIGAGPTGLSLAAQLIRQGIDFIQIDKATTTTTLSKALVVHARTMEIFKELGLSDVALSKGQITRHLNIIRHGKTAAQVPLTELGKGLSEFPFVLSLEQSRTEEIFYDYIKQHKKDVIWQSEITELEQQEESVIISYKDKDGMPQKIEAQYAVGCDGAHSPVRHQLGLGFEGGTALRTFFVADVICKSEVLSEKDIYFFPVKEAILLFFAMEGDNHFRIIGMIPQADQSMQQVKFEDIAPSIKKQVEVPIEFVEVKWFSTYKISSRKANSFATERCFLCGDAAHIHTPAGGQGMNTGIQDGYNLA